MSDYASLQTLLALHRHGSLTAAARALDSPKSTLSRRLAMLENELGYRLTHIEHGRLMLTDAGRCYVQYSEKIIALYKEAQRALRNNDNEPRGKINLRICADMSHIWITNVCCSFTSRHPDIHLDLRQIDAGGIRIDGDDDIWLCCAAPDRCRVQEDEGLEQIILGEWGQRLYISAYPQTQPTPHHITDLEGLPCILKSDECETITLWHEPSGSQYCLQPAAQLRFDSLLTQAHAVASGNGIGILPMWVAECPRHGFKGKFMPVLPEWQAPPVRLLLFLRKGFRAQRIKMLVNYLQEQLPPHWRFPSRYCTYKAG